MKSFQAFVARTTSILVEQSRKLGGQWSRRASSQPRVGDTLGLARRWKLRENIRPRQDRSQPRPTRQRPDFVYSTYEASRLTQDSYPSHCRIAEAISYSIGHYSKFTLGKDNFTESTPSVTTLQPTTHTHLDQQTMDTHRTTDQNAYKFIINMQSDSCPSDSPYVRNQM